MTTVFSAALGVCGLTGPVAAELLGYSLGSIKAWSSGATSPPIDAWKRLAGLYEQIVTVSEAALDEYELDDLDMKALNRVSVIATGEPLPVEGAQAAAVAMFVLARFADE